MNILMSIFGTALVAILGWVFQLGIRVSVLESKHEDLTLLINTKFDEVNRRLERMEKAMNGLLIGH